ncbi:phospholipase-like protein, partial [Tanacetum coccineum]
IQKQKQNAATTQILLPSKVTVAVAFALLRRLCRCVDVVVVLVLLTVVVENDTEIVPLTYHLGGDIEIQFGMEEFCLVTGLKFGVDYSSDYSEGVIPFKRRVFDSTKDGHAITIEMLEDKIKSKVFLTMNHNDVVSLCLLAIVECVLLCQEPRHNVPEWCLRLVDDRNWRNLYPWGSYVWSTLYSSLRDANVRRWPVFYATPVEEDDDKHKSMTSN